MAVMLGNVMEMNHYFILPGVVGIIFSIISFIYVKPLIVSSQKLALKKLSPLFHLISETMNGITQIAILKRRFEFLKSFSSKVDIVTRSKMTFEFHGRTFSVAVYYMMVVLLTLGMLMGIYNLTPQNAAYYGVQIVFLVEVSEYLQWSLRLLIYF